MAHVLRFLAVKGFARFQHYRDRNPPWIKLHATVLTDLAFLEMPEAAQAQLVKLWVLASQLGHPLPNNPRLLAGKIGATGRFHLARIIAAGFLIPCDENASRIASTDASALLDDPLEKSSALTGGDARSRESSELERENNTTPPACEPPPWQPIREQDIALRLATIAGRTALAAILHVTQSDVRKSAIVMALGAYLDGDNGAHLHATGEEMDRALSDYVQNGMSQGEQWSADHFRKFVVTAMRTVREGDSSPVQRNTTPAKGPGQRAYDNAMLATEDL